MKNKALTVLAALAMVGCTPEWARENDSNLLMVITGIEAEPGGETTEAGAVLLSDVDPVFNDIAQVTVQVMRKNPFATSTPLEDLILTRYEVRYFRTDGRNQEGVDVPYRITGPLNLLIHAPTGTGESNGIVSIDVVRHQAKLEAPLLALKNFVTDTGAWNFGGSGIMTVIAEITVFGRTVNDRSLSATGQLQVTFANFAGDE